MITETTFDALIEECELDMLRIAADAGKELTKGLSVDDCFACFVGAFTPVRILQNINVNKMKIKTNADEKIETNADERIENFGENYEFEEEGIEEDDIYVSPNTFHFFEIMCKDPASITQEEKREAFKLFPEAFQFIRTDVI